MSFVFWGDAINGGRGSEEEFTMEGEGRQAGCLFRFIKKEREKTVWS